MNTLDHNSFSPCVGVFLRPVAGARMAVIDCGLLLDIAHLLFYHLSHAKLVVSWFYYINASQAKCPHNMFYF